MASAGKVLDIARSEIGTKESPPDSNVCKYSKWYPMAGSPWCAMFVSWVLDKAGVDGYKHAYTPAGAEMFRSRNRWLTTGVEPGDIAYFDFPDSLHRIQHVGFVETVNPDGTYSCIEGNTSAGSGGSQDNGGGVFRRVRTRSLIAGFGRPPYDGAASPRATRKVRQKTWFSLGDSGADVRTWQRQLNTVMEADVDVDGRFGPKTLEATRAFQMEHGLDVDGKVGKATIAKMEELFREVKKDRAGKPPTIELYDGGKWVVKAQELLIGRGFDLSPHGADGDFGPVTAEAVRQFKKSEGLPGTPVLGPRAWRLLTTDA